MAKIKQKQIKQKQTQTQNHTLLTEWVDFKGLQEPLDRLRFFPEISSHSVGDLLQKGVIWD